MPIVKTRTEQLIGVPGSELQRVMDSFRSEGALVTSALRADGTSVVTAVFTEALGQAATPSGNGFEPSASPAPNAARPEALSPTDEAATAESTAFDQQAFADFMGSLNLKHFKPYELLVMGARNSDRQSPCFGLNGRPPRGLWPNMVLTIRVLDALRVRLDAPVRITSTYRSNAYNRCIGGARESEHMNFRAIDFAAEGGSRPVDWARALRSMRDDDGMFRGGVGLYDTFVHVDTRGSNVDW